jgi:hypothetical protein
MADATLADIERAIVHVQAARRAALAAETLLRAVGRQLTDVPLLDPIPLDKLSTPASRRLLALLEETQEAAEQVDSERGRSLGTGVPLQPGESRGTNFAESLSAISLRVRIEVNGTMVNRLTGSTASYGGSFDLHLTTA